MSLRKEDGYNSDVTGHQIKLKQKKRFRRGSKQFITGIHKPSIARLARTGGIKRVSGEIYDDSVSVLKSYVSELTEKTNILQEQLKQQSMAIEILNTDATNNEIQIRLMTAENEEYKQIIKQANYKYEEVLNVLTETREHLNHATHQIEQYEETIQLLNNEIIHKTDKHDVTIKVKESNSEVYKLKFEELQKTHHELSAEYTKYTNDYQQLMDKQIKLEQNNKILNEQITEMTCNNVQLQKQVNDFSMEIATQKEIIQCLQNKRQNVLCTPNHSPAKTEKQFYSPLKHTDGYIALSDCSECKDLEQIEHDGNLYSMYQTCEDNEEYWNNQDTEQKNMETIDETKSEISVYPDEEMQKYFRRDRTISFAEEKIRIEMKQTKKSSFCTIQ